MQTVLIQVALIIKNKLRIKYLVFDILVKAGVRFHFGLELVSNLNAFDQIQGYFTVNNYKMIKKIISNSSNSELSAVLKTISDRGSTSIFFEYILNLIDDFDFSEVIKYFCYKNNHRFIIIIFKKNDRFPKYDLNKFLNIAFYTKNNYLINVFRKMGASITEKSIKYAYWGGCEIIIRQVTKDWSNPQLAFVGACKNGSLSLVKRTIHGATNLNEGLLMAIKFNHIEVIEYLCI